MLTTYLKQVDAELLREIEFFGEHGHNAWYLFHAVEAGQIGGGFKVQRYFVIDTCHDLHDLQLPAVSGQHLTQRCDEPRAITHIPPGIITWTHRKSHGYV